MIAMDFDDIHWSPAMEDEAGNDKKTSQVTVTIDTFQCLFSLERTTKEHFNPSLIHKKQYIPDRLFYVK
jgi:hypothetical protein